MLIDKKAIEFFNKIIEKYLESTTNTCLLDLFKTKSQILLAQIVVENLIKMNMLSANGNRIKLNKFSFFTDLCS